MNLETLKEIVKVAKDGGLTELSVESKDFKVSLSFQGVSSPIVHHQQTVSSQPPIVQSQSNAPAANSQKNVTLDKNYHVIKSPFVGTFYTSPSPGKPVYVKVGDRVKPGQTLCVLEAMKIMNEIEADVNGEIVEICADNESLVEYGQPLFKVKI